MKPKEAEVSETAKEKKARKRREAEERQEARENRTDAEQLAVLAARGVTTGSEVARLKARL